MLGAIIGYIVGSIYEFDNAKTKGFRLFQDDSRITDETVCTIAVAPRSTVCLDDNDTSLTLTTLAGSAAALDQRIKLELTPV